MPFSERPELWERIPALSAEVWPEYNRHGDVTNRYWDRLYEEFPAYQFVLYDEKADDVLAEGHSAPCTWDRTVPGLGPGLDAALVGAFELRRRGGEPNTLCALAVEIPPRHRRRGLSTLMLEAMVDLARAGGFAHLIAPVRPSTKDRYPLVPIGRYARWQRRDGLPFDPWLRVHVRLGGEIAAALPRSLRITATVEEWERWTDLTFVDSGPYVFPEGQAPLEVDRAAGTATYFEPNVWVVHCVPPRPDRPEEGEGSSTDPR